MIKHLPPQQQGLTQAGVKDLMDAAASAWEKMPETGRKAKFSWRGKRYVVTASNLRLLVHTADGLPMACRYH
jgi:hypothetical protein